MAGPTTAAVKPGAGGALGVLGVSNPGSILDLVRGTTPGYPVPAATPFADPTQDDPTTALIKRLFGAGGASIDPATAGKTASLDRKSVV